MRRVVRRLLPLLVTALFFFLVFQRVPYQRLLAALSDANYVRFLALMVPNALIYIAWDTLVLKVAIQWFHRPIPYVTLLPIRAASYVFAVFNTNAGRGALAIFAGRVLSRPILQVGSTVIFLLLTEYIHLLAWATVGILSIGPDVTHSLLWLPPLVAAGWLMFFAYARASAYYESPDPPPTTWSRIGRLVTAPWRGSLLRTFRLAPARRYVQTVLLRAPMFFASLCFHYFAIPAFGFEIPFGHLLTFLPVVFMVATLPITVARLGTTQAAWILLFGRMAPVERLLAFSLAAALTFSITRALVGLILLPRAYSDLVERPGTARPDRPAVAVG
jgi:hypothetical protein